MNTLRTLGFGLTIVVGGAGLAGAQVPGANLRATFEKLDANGDMVLERSEIPPRGMPAFERLLKVADTNKDGKVEAAELRELIQAGAGVGFGNGQGMARLKAMDKDGDGKVSKAEFTGQPAAFDRLDTNKDGMLEIEEVRVAGAAATKAGNPIGAGAAFAPGSRIMAMDKDGDGKVSKTEFLGQPAAFDRFDTDNDGFLTKDEAVKGATAAFDRIRAMDKDGDGKISRDEFTGQPAAFDRLDTDKDGSLSFQEIGNGGAGAGAGNPAVTKKGATTKKKAKP